MAFFKHAPVKNCLKVNTILIDIPALEKILYLVSLLFRITAIQRYTETGNRDAGGAITESESSGRFPGIIEIVEFFHRIQLMDI